jgi:hypothetical protein
MTQEELSSSLTTPLKLVKPDMSAFSFSGYLQKSKSNSKINPTPRTPSKRANTKLLFHAGPPTPLFTHPRHPSTADLRSDDNQDISTTDSPFSPFLSSDDREMVSPSFSRRIERSSSFGGSSPDPLAATVEKAFDFEATNEDIMDSEKSYPHWIQEKPNFLSLDFFHELDVNPYFLGSTDNYSDEEFFHQNFQVLEVIGRGAFADVYKCSCHFDNRLYSVKKTRESFTGFLDRYRKLGEARVLFDVGQHPHCLQIFLSWEQRGYCYIQSELCEFGSLAYFINLVSFQEEALSEQLIWAIILQISLVSNNSLYLGKLINFFRA